MVQELFNEAVSCVFPLTTNTDIYHQDYSMNLQRLALYLQVKYGL